MFPAVQVTTECYYEIKILTHTYIFVNIVSTAISIYWHNVVVFKGEWITGSFLSVSAVKVEFRV